MRHRPPGALRRDPEETRRIGREVLLISVVVWVAHFGVMVSRAVITGMAADPGSMLARVFAAGSGVLAAYVIYRVLQRVEAKGVSRRFLWAALLGAPGCLFVALVNELSFWLFSDAHDKAGMSLFDPRELVWTVTFFAWIFVAWAGLYAAAMNAADVRERDRKLAVAEAAANQAQLTALRFQINPHFLFNTLNALTGLIELQRGREARDVTLNLASFLRYSLGRSQFQRVPLSEEIEAQRLYLAIEQVRFGERLTVQVEIEPGCERAMVPSLILQPLVENAIKYGLGRAERGVTLALTAGRVDGRLVLTVEDSGADAEARLPEPGFGIGLSNVRQRLAALYGEHGGLEAGPTEDGWRSVVSLPWEPER